MGIYAEIVLRPSPTGAPLVQRELYVYNPSTSTGTKDFQVYFGEDTALDSTGSTANDDVPIYAIGNGEGLYLYSNKNVSQGDSKVYVTNNVEDGFNHFMGRIFGSPESWDTKGKADDSSAGEILNPNLNRGVTTKDNIGDTDREAGSSLLFGKNKYDREYKVVNAKGQQDSAYTLRWEQISLEKNQTAHFSSTMGASISGYALPEPSKTYTNPKQDADGWNHVGDTLHFTLDMTNNGFKSYWDYNQIQDEMPTGLEIDPDSVKYVWSEMQTNGSGTTQTDTEVIKSSGSVNSSFVQNNTLNFNPNTQLVEKGRYKITFDATITQDAIQNSADTYLTNTANFRGYNNNTPGTIDAYTDSVSIPVRKPKFQYQFTKKLRNVTADANSSFVTETTGQAGDIIEYQVRYLGSGTDYLKSARFLDDLPSSLELVPGSVTMNGTSMDGLDFNLSNVQNGYLVNIIFQAKVVSTIQDKASNIALFNNLVTSGGTTIQRVESNSADLNIEAPSDSTFFVEVPELISFGSINTTGTQKLLTNTSLNGNLIVTHTADSAFDVSVSYDNEGEGALTAQGNKLLNDAENVLSLNQKDNSGNGVWKALSTNPLPINPDGFSGSVTDLDLTDYIGLNQWKLRIPADAKAGVYQGKVTWTMSESL
ncbi:isopeptide-forming domain-containing fimbrial protein [Companilactobacillus suantsaicola]|uniref:Isopeptide-forming domain-containing fimbrial protein n=1 Tax=Companilactobacillus suantsaicola TaxID=2487723 RepID=A0A4Z0JQR1_9LACO|nr:isopeptide-forming domain-containing fimbrial protein [Companilactobacillus suantsaicola]TGD25420.1 isopeptide-forming domain-containing fimbrial protein [Companilactobacillus suantsaicola]